MTHHPSELSSSKPWSKSLSPNRRQAIAQQEANSSAPLRCPRQRDPRRARAEPELQEDPSFHTSHQGRTHGRSRALQNPAGKYPLAPEQRLTPDFPRDAAVKWPVFPMTCHQHLRSMPMECSLRY